MAAIRTGLQVLSDERFRTLRGRRVGLVTNPTGILPDLQSNIAAMQNAGVTIAALYGPEHGVRGDVPAGKYIASSKDGQSGLPVFSLYGETKVPSAEMLRNVDLLVFDIQDIGSRSYTYLSTLGSVMEGAARHKVPLMVLDRPNPLGLTRVEGSPTEPGFTSFVGKYPMSYVHGMTLGECARMINGEGWLPGSLQCEVMVQPCGELARTTVPWADNALPWVPSSPHIPRPLSSHFYAATGIVGELDSISIGIGYPLPFELIGKPGINGASLARNLQKRAIPGWDFRAAFWQPFYSHFTGETCAGAQIYLQDPARAELTRLNFEIIDALRIVAPGLRLFGSENRMFDLSCGTNKIRAAYAKGANAVTLNQIWNSGRDGFLRRRRRYLLY